MLSILIAVGRVPDGTQVRKPTGDKPYAVRRKLQIFGNPPEVRVIMSDKIVYLVGHDGSINGVTEDTRVAIDFRDPEDAIGFLETFESQQ